MDQLVIVAGGGGALGCAVATELIDRDIKVVIVDLAAPNLPVGAEFEAADLTSDEDVGRVYRKIADDHGSPSGVVNVVGGFAFEPMAGGSSATWDDMYRINLKTVVTSCQAALALLEDGASIVNVGAAAACRPGSGMAPYCASKAGVHVLTESLAEEMRPRLIRVNAVLPTIIDTPANRVAMPDADPAGWVSPARAAKAIAFLLSDDASAVTGACVPLSG